jgi:hypothetical protein
LRCRTSVLVVDGRALSRETRAGEWWRVVAQYPHGVPGIVRELLRTLSVVCHPTEAEQALAWAQARPAWVDGPAPLVVDDPDA